MLYRLTIFIFLLCANHIAYAQVLPGSVDAGRIQAEQEDLLAPREEPLAIVPKATGREAIAPEGAEG